MKKIIYCIVLLTCVIGISACSKTESSQNVDSISCFDKNNSGFEALRSDIIHLNDISIPSETKVPRWLGWLGVGISDAVGGAVGAAYGGVWGGIALGVISSIEAYFCFVEEMQMNVSSVNSINSIGNAEESFNFYTLESGTYNNGVIGGYYHNVIIRELLDDYGNDLFLMSEEQLKAAVVSKTAVVCGPNLGTIDLTDFAVGDLVYNREEDVTPEMYINRIQLLNPTVALELSIIDPILTGVNGIENEEDRVDYIQDVVELIDDSSIPIESKRTIISGATIALESSLLWNVE